LRSTSSSDVQAQSGGRSMPAAPSESLGKSWSIALRRA